MGLFNLFKKAEEPKETTQITKPKVLVVDDEEYLRDAYKELLEGDGFEVLTANNGQEALLSAQEHKPDAIILDVMMPVMDGMQVLEELNKNELTKKIPVVVLTNAGNIENMESAKYHKAFRFLIKSNIIPDEVVKSARDAVGMSRDNNL
jgi:CheY-like chemotaxis protein